LEQIKIGMRVLVPFGGKKIYTGIVAEIHHNEPEAFLPKEIHSILDQNPLFPKSNSSFGLGYQSITFVTLAKFIVLLSPVLLN